MICAKWSTYYINRTDYPSEFSQRSGLRRILFEESCLRCILFHKKSSLRRSFSIEILLLHHSVVNLISSILFGLPIHWSCKWIELYTQWLQRHNLYQIVMKKVSNGSFPAQNGECFENVRDKSHSLDDREHGCPILPQPEGTKCASQRNHNDPAANAPHKKRKSQAQAHDRVCTTPSPRGRTRAGRHGQSKARNRTRTAAALDDGRPAEQTTNRWRSTEMQS